MKSRTINFHLPGDEKSHLVELSSDLLGRYHQLVCWCLVQRFWYYVLGNPQVTDQEYDYIEHEVALLEMLLPVKNKYTPTMTVGSNWIGDYPHSIHILFRTEL